MVLAFQIAYGNLVRGLMAGNQGWLKRMNQLVEIPEGAANGAVSLTYISLVTAAAVSDGSVCTNNTDSVTANATLVDYQATVSLKPSQADSFYSKPENIRTIAQAHADAFYVLQQNVFIVDLIASTPLTNATKTLTIGQIDFATDGTQAEKDDNLTNMAIVVAIVKASHQGSNADLSIVMDPTPYARFIVLNSTGVQAPVALLNPSTMDGADYSFMGIPVFVISGAADFSGADKHCAFVTAKDGMILARKQIKLHGGGIIYASDATSKLISTGPFAHGVITGMFGEVINPSS